MKSFVSTFFKMVIDRDLFYKIKLMMFILFGVFSVFEKPIFGHSCEIIVRITETLFTALHLCYELILEL